MKKIFVSSTFRDMQFERDMIRERVTPEINARAHKKYGESVSFCDLRWGINTSNLTERESAQKVLEVCLNEIDRCKPYMIVILGDRYGWIPNQELVVDAANQKNFTIGKFDHDLSVTALEIYYGALSNSDQMKRTLFYFRRITGYSPSIYRSEDKTHEEKLNTLKNKIIYGGGYVRYYDVSWNIEKECFDGMETFSNMVIADVSNLMKTEFEQYSILTEYERDPRMQWEYAKQKAEYIAGRDEIINHYTNILNNNIKSLVIQGESGCGKSTVMSKLAFILSKQGYTVLPVFVGLTSKTNSPDEILKYIVECMEREIHKSPKYDDDIDIAETMNKTEMHLDRLKNDKSILYYMLYFISYMMLKFYNALSYFTYISRCFDYIKKKSHSNINYYKQVSSFAFPRRIVNDYGFDDYVKRFMAGVDIWNSTINKKFIILVDAIDQLIDNSERERLINLLRRGKTSGKIQTIMSCTPDLMFQQYQHDEIQVEFIHDLDRATKHLIMHSILKSINREIDSPVINAIDNKIQSKNPLYLSLLIHRLTMMNKQDFDAIDSGGGQMDARNSRQVQLVNKCANDLNGICVDIIDEATKHIGGKSVQIAVNYIAIARYGLRESDLIGILALKGISWNSLDFALFIKYLEIFSFSVMMGDMIFRTRIYD